MSAPGLGTIPDSEYALFRHTQNGVQRDKGHNRVAVPVRFDVRRKTSTPEPAASRPPTIRPYARAPCSMTERDAFVPPPDLDLRQKSRSPANCGVTERFAERRSTVTRRLHKCGMPASTSYAPFWLMAVLLTAPVTGAVVVLTPDADAGLRNGNPDINSGIASDYIVGALAVGEVHRALLRFDLKSIPTNAVIQHAQLIITDVSRQGAQALATFELRRVLRPWTEGTNFGFGVAAGEVSWNSARHGQQLWELAGASGASDAIPEISGSTGSGGQNLTFLSTAGLVADVQHWVLAPSLNYGWRLSNDRESTPRSARRLASREHSSSPPKLSIQYVLPTPPILELAESRDGGAVRLSGSAAPGQMVKVEYSTDLREWRSIGQALADSAGRLELLHDVASENGQVRRFYRFVE